MVSLKASVEQLDELERQSEAAYTEAMQCVETKVLPLFPQAWERQRPALRAAMQACIAERTPLLEAALSAYAHDAKASQQQDYDSLRELLAKLAAAAEQTAGRSATQSERFHGIRGQLATLTAESDPQILRVRLIEQVAAFHSCLEQTAAENRAAVRKMEAGVQDFALRMAELEALASQDPLTGAANRREFERRVQLNVEAEEAFCILLIDLNGFKGVNDRFGHAFGDEILKTCAKTLREHTRPMDLCARWGGDEFVLVLHCSVRDAYHRAQQIGDALSRRRLFSWNDRQIQLGIPVSTGVVEHLRGQSIAELFERADRAMYAVKTRA